MIDKRIEDEEYAIATLGDEAFVMFAKTERDHWDYDNQTFSWDVTVYKMIHLWDNPALYIKEKPTYRASGCDYIEMDMASIDMNEEVHRVEQMYADGSLANREGMFPEIHRDYLAALIEAARLGRTELDMIYAFGLSDDRLNLRYEALYKLDKALKQMEDH